MTEAKTSDNPFVAYYEEQSASPGALAHFARVRASLLAIFSDQRSSARLRVADVGCGAGTFSRIWAREGAEVKGIDVNASLIQIARQRADAERLCIEFAVGSATELPWSDRDFDIVVMPELLEHVEDWRRCLREGVRVLDAGGLLYLTTTNRLCPKQQEFSLPLYSWYPARLKKQCLDRALTDRRHWVSHAEYPAVHWFSPYQLAEEFVALGLEPLDRFQVFRRFSPSMPKRIAGAIADSLPPLRFLGHVLTPSTVIIGRKVA